MGEVVSSVPKGHARRCLQFDDHTVQIKRVAMAYSDIRRGLYNSGSGNMCWLCSAFTLIASVYRPVPDVEGGELHNALVMVRNNMATVNTDQPTDIR